MTAADESRASAEHEAPSAPSGHGDLDVAFGLLVEATSELAASGRPPTGSEVRLALKHRTHDGFDPKSLGFRRFRDFLAAAADRGLVEVDEARPGDVAVAPPSTHGPASSPPAIRGDLWRAFVEWSPDELRVYDVAQGRAVRLPRVSVPLEPQRFAELRRRIDEVPGDFVEIPAIGARQQLAWMRQFADSRPKHLREVLAQALDGDKPAKTFVALLRAVPEEHSRWEEALLSHVRRRVEQWRTDAGLDIPIDKRPAPEQMSEPPLPVTAPARARPSDQAGDRWRSHQGQGLGAPSTETTLAAFEALSRARATSAGDGARARRGGAPAGHDELRQRLHAAIDRMPEEELRRLRVPVGYLFEE